MSARPDSELPQGDNAPVQSGLVDAEDQDYADNLALIEQMESRRRITDKSFGWMLVVLGAVAFVAAMALTIEKFLKLENPDHQASCSINIFLDCAAAMGSAQGSIFGFPNQLIGIFAFTVVIVSGVVVLAGATLPRWYWRALLVGTTLGMAMIVFLMYTSIHTLGRLCPYCMVVWAMMIPLLWYQIVRGVQEGYVPASSGVRMSLMRYKHVILPFFYLAVVVWIGVGMGPEIVNYLNAGR